MRNSLFRLTFWLAVCGSGAIIAGLAAFYLYLSPKLPSVESLRHVKLQTPLRVYSRDGLLIGEFGEKRRTPIQHQDIPELYTKALLAAEDDQFYSHNGVSIRGLLRAASQIISSGHIQSGGSTITMQVARNFFLTRQQTFARKFNEILLALQIERELSKDEILELYVNVIFLGNRAYGINAAAEVYYGKPLSELSLAQLAMIAGLPKAPSTFNPIANPERALIRRNWILGRMLSLGYIDQNLYDTTINEPVTASVHGIKVDYHAPYVAEMARRQAMDIYGPGAYTDGLKVYTTIDSGLQRRAQEAVIDGLLAYDKRKGYRGPEQHWPASFIDPSVTDVTDFNNLDLAAWQSALGNLSEFGGLEPAVVVQVFEQQIRALLPNGDIVDIDWEQGLRQARPFKTENARGARPKLASDVVAVGDVIRLQQNDDDSWAFSQVPKAQAALIALNPKDGAIISMVGGFDFAQSHFNRVTQAKRQPGSNFKPFVYTTALEQGLTPASIINDAPIVFEDANLESTWRPENDGGKFYGPTRLRQALYRSRNLVSIRVLRNIGINNAIKGMDRFGFEPALLPKDLSLALGSYALTPLEIVTGYAVFANGGFRVEPYLLSSILDVNGEAIYEANPATACPRCETLLAGNEQTEESTVEPQEILHADEDRDQLTDALANNEQSNNEPGQQSAPAEAMQSNRELNDELASELASELAVLNQENDVETFEATSNEPAFVPPANPAERVLNPQVAYLINSMLQDVIRKGTGTAAKTLGRNDLAGKTGTTNGPRDAWFSGYNSEMVVTTWLGFDQNLMLGRREYGGSAALPIWIDYMRTALKDVPESKHPQPEGIITVRIDPKTGERANINTIGAIYESFRLENAPELLSNESIGNSDSEEALPEELF
ncbi:penicillin-binding protein 1A [Pseudoteredinibacter isoporae]|uniref:Penicillin-binding protein 1A n=1 Tax=Pseudoteredinibacter isoporae TaxID=570281 RepID=A0A7X0JPA2_9GAMM|nr:penicillin-binding protein 1A [Pseudoteredinibacter isoporae]MBB6519804.1 penicillin-binding protein 1A [Pseudoteredinibacter isoporae]